MSHLDRPPRKPKRALIEYGHSRTHARIHAQSAALGPSLRLLDYHAMDNILYMAKTEMVTVKELDAGTVEANADKMVLYYAPGDGWAPESHYEELKERFPNVRYGREIGVGVGGLCVRTARVVLRKSRVASASRVFAPCSIKPVLQVGEARRR